MSPKTAALLADPHPRCHIVFPYTGEVRITEAVSLFTAGGLSRNETVVLISTRDHCDAIEARLVEDGFDLKQLKSEGRLVVLDAEEILSTFLVDGVPDAERFHKVAGTIIEKAKVDSPTGKVRLFGEMVSLLYGQNLEGAAVLEELWNSAIDTYCVPLLCTYALDGPEPEAQNSFPQRLRACHSHTLAA